MKIICIGNYLPRQCGIATFTVNFVQAITLAAEAASLDIDLKVIAMNDGGREYDYPAVVSKTIPDQNPESYIQMADYINQSGADCCFLQHEYGIYGGASGVLILSLLRRLKVPVISILHTVLQKPGFHEKEVLKKIAAYSHKVVVMNRMAIGFLKNAFGVPDHKIMYIQHGVPDFETLKDKLPPAPKNWSYRTVILTFGLIGRSKGIETAIKALPPLVKEFPDLLYVVLGKTHPNVVRIAGEEYRKMLKQLVKSLGLEAHVQFIDKYLTEEELMAHLKAADIYVTPYHNKAQITSGTLSYAVAGGCAVFSTPYWHAEELLVDGRGILFDFGNHEELSQKIREVLTSRNMLKIMQQLAYEYGKSLAWPRIGKEYLEIAFDINAQTSSGTVKLRNGIKQPVNVELPAFDANHLFTLTDNTGLLQHANGCIPCYKTGYCIDDNSRALILCLMAFQRYRDQKFVNLSTRYLALIKHMQADNGSFSNYLTYDRRLHSWKNSDDATGRTIWALGYLIRFAPNDSMMHVGLEVFVSTINKLGSLRYARGFANTILGLYHYTKRFPDQERYLHLLTKQADGLCDVYRRHRKDRWHWFEDRMTYDNGLLPAALYLAWERNGDSRYLEIAEESRKFLESKCFAEDYLTLIGNKKWLGLDDKFELFAQQPVDALAMVILYDILHSVHKTPEAAEKLRKSFLWFLGYNSLDIPLYDTETHGCCDGIEPMNINRNQGAESIVAWLMAHLISEPYFI